MTSSGVQPTRKEKIEDCAGGPDMVPTAGAALVPGPYATVAETADVLRVHPKTVRSRVKSGELEAYRRGRRILIPLAAILRFIEQGRL